MDTVENMFYCISSFVYTTKLEDMVILRGDIKKKKFKNVVKSIIAESKPRFLTSQTQSRSSKLRKPNDVIFEKIKLGCCPKNDMCVASYVNKYKSHVENSTHFNNITKKGEIEDKAKINMSNESSSSGSKNDRPKNYSDICKPVRVLLTNINNMNSKKSNVNDEIVPEVLYISSDEDDEVCLQEKDKEMQNITKSMCLNHELINPTKSTEPGDEITDWPPSNYIIRNINDFKKIILETELKNTIIVMYNSYTGKSDVYAISNTYSLRTITKAYSSARSKAKLMTTYSRVCNIITCCWRARHSYVKLLCRHDKLFKLGNAMWREHFCTNFSCKCCCVSTTMNNMELNVPNKTENLITAALNFPLKPKKQTKWKPATESATTPTSNDLNCTRLIKLHYNNDSEQIYELGPKDVLYSKTVNGPDRPESSWVRKTQAKNKILNVLPQKQNYLRYLRISDASKIVHYAEFLENDHHFDMFNNYPNALGISETVLAKTVDIEETDAPDSPLPSNLLNNSQISLITNVYNSEAKNENTKSGTNSLLLSDMVNNSKELQNRNVKYMKDLSTVHNKDSSTSASQRKNQQVLGHEKASKGATDLETITKEVLEEKNVSKDVTSTVQSLISNILNRFRNVQLTINADGKVSAALKDPLKSLASSELKILSEILTFAQNQVDKLGLKSGTCIGTNITSNAPLISKPPAALSPPMTCNATLTSNAHLTSDPLVISNYFSALSSPVTSKATFTSNASLVSNPPLTLSSILTSNSPLNFNSFVISNPPKVNNENDSSTTNKEDTSNKKLRQTKILALFSQLICERKASYEVSFQQYSSEARLVLPEITSVYSLSSENASSTSPNVSGGTKAKKVKIDATLENYCNDHEEPKNKKRKKGTEED